MKKIFKLLSVLLVLSIILVGCKSNNDNTTNNNNESEDVSNQPTEKTDVNIVGLNGPTSIGMVKLVNENALYDKNYNVKFEFIDSTTDISEKILKGKVQIAAIPTNLASELYNKSEKGIQFLTENSLGSLCMVGKGDLDIKNIQDLEGKHIMTKQEEKTSKAASQYVIDYILKNNNLKDKISITTNPDSYYYADPSYFDIHILPEPFVTKTCSHYTSMKIFFDLSEEWEKISQGKSALVMDCIIVNKKFAENNKDFVNKFLEEYKKSVEFVNSNPADASIIVRDNKIIDKSANYIEKAIPNCNIVFKTAQDAKLEVNEYLKILFDYEKECIGGKLPDDDFYYQK